MENCIKVFVSYSWDSDNHRAGVVQFVNRLRKEEIHAVYDGDLSLGDRMTHFMEREIADSDYILYICTPAYKAKADSRERGVGYESNIISYEIYESNDERKFIPILFSGTWKDSLPIWSLGKIGVDLRSGSNFDSEFNKLIAALKKEESVSIDDYVRKNKKAFKGINEIAGLPKDEIRALLSEYIKVLENDKLNGELLSVIGYCYLELGMFEQAAIYINQSISLIQDEQDNYYYLAIASLKGKRPFLASLAIVQQIMEDLSRVLLITPKGKYYALLAVIQHDFYEKKKLNNKYSSAYYFSQAKEYGFTQKEENELYRFISLT